MALKNIYDVASFVRGSISNETIEYPEISFGIQEETMIDLFGEITGTGAAAQAWQIWVKGSDRVYGAHDVTLLEMFEGYMQPLPSFGFRLPQLKTSQFLNLLLSCRKQIRKDVMLRQGVVHNALDSMQDKFFVIHDCSDFEKVHGMIAPFSAGCKGNFMSTTYLFTDWRNGGMDFHEAQYGKWLQEVYKQLVDGNRSMGDRKCESEEWELKMHKLLKLGTP